MNQLILGFAFLAFLLLALQVFLKPFGQRSNDKQRSNIPGPFLNQYTVWPLKIQILKGNRVHYIHQLHEHYGPCVRISPTEIAIGDLQSTRQIHRIGGGFLKDPWYQNFTDESSPGIFAMIDPKVHAVRRKLFSYAFSQNALAEWEELLQTKVDLAISGMRRQSAVEGSADILQWWTFMATDVIGELGFGESFRALEHGEKSVYSQDLETTMFFAGMRTELPLVVAAMSILPIPSIQHQLQATKRLLSYGTAAIERSQYLNKCGEAKRTLFSKMLEVDSDQEKQGFSFSKQEMEREAANFIVAGSDTTAVTLTYLIWTVLKHPSVKQNLMAELEEVSDVVSTQLGKLPYLAAVIQEVLRLYGAAPASLPRSVPKGGRQLGDYFIAEGFTVSTQAWTLHRDESIFPRAEEFMPERWFNPTRDMKDAMMPFGGGSRVCIGLHLAHMELALGAAKFLTEFPNAEISVEMTDEDMKPENYFLIAPKSHKCRVIVG